MKHVIAPTAMLPSQTTIQNYWMANWHVLEPFH